MLDRAITGCILGTAVGDSLGLPYEGISPDRAQRLFKDLGRHHFLFGRGMISDDTEHACFVAQALLKSHGDPDIFEKRLAWSLKWWLLGLPAGIGMATLKSIIKLWLGFSPAKSGISSAGNGPSMRSALLGVAYGGEPHKLSDLVKRSTRITHSDPRAYHGALAIAVAAHHSATFQEITPEGYKKSLKDYIKGNYSEEFFGLISRAAASALAGEAVANFSVSIGCKKGISGYTFHTVPCVIQAWLHHYHDFRSGLTDVLAAGGDTDTVGAILGGIIGARVGKEGIPSEWLSRIIEWPRSVKWMEELAVYIAKSLGSNIPSKPKTLFIPAVLLRNIFFTAIVLVHGFRRLAPPY